MQSAYISRQSVAYPSDEVIFKKIYDLCTAYQSSELASSSSPPSPSSLKKRFAKEHFESILAELINKKNHNDQKIQTVADLLNKILLISPPGDKLVKKLQALINLINFRIEINLKKSPEQDVYVLEMDRTLVEQNQKSGPHFNTGLIEFLKGKTVSIVDSFDPEHIYYAQPSADKVSQQLAEQGIKMQNVYMPTDNMDDIASLEKANQLASSLLSQKEYELCVQRMETRNFLQEIRPKIVEYLRKRFKLKGLPPGHMADFFEPILMSLRSEEMNYANLFWKTGEEAVKQLEKYIVAANKPETLHAFLTYLEKNSKEPELPNDKLKAFRDLEDKLSALRKKMFLDRSKRINRTDLYSQIINGTHPENVARVVVIKTDPRIPASTQSTHPEVLTLSPFVNGDQGFGRSHPSDYMSREKFLASIHEKSVFMMQSELQVMLFDARNLQMLKVDSKKPSDTMKLQDQAYRLPSPIVQMIKLLLQESQTAVEVHEHLTKIKAIATAALTDNPDRGIANAFYRGIVKGLEHIARDPSSAQKDLSTELLRLDNALSGKPLSYVNRVNREEKPGRVVVLLDVDDTLLTQFDGKVSVNTSLLSALQEIKARAEKNNQEFAVELLTSYKLDDKSPQSVLRKHAIDALAKINIKVDRVVIQGRKLGFYEQVMAPVEEAMLSLKDMDMNRYADFSVKVDTEKQKIAALRFLKQQPDFKDQNSELQNILDDAIKTVSKMQKKQETNEALQKALKPFIKRFEEWQRTHAQSFLAQEKGIQLLGLPASLFLIFYTTIAQDLKKYKELLRSIKATEKTYSENERKDLQSVFDLKREYQRADLAASYAAEQGIDNSEAAVKKRTGSKSSAYEAIVADRMLNSNDTLYYFDDDPHYRSDIEKLHQEKPHLYLHHMKALRPPFGQMGTGFAKDENKYTDKTHQDMDNLTRILHDQPLFHQLKDFLLSPYNLAEWSITNAADNPPRGKIASLFASIPPTEKVVVRQRSGQMGLYDLPPNIAKMVSLALDNKDEELVKFVRDGIAQGEAFKLGSKPAHEDLRSFLDDVIKGHSTTDSERPEEEHHEHRLG